MGEWLRGAFGPAYVISSIRAIYGYHTLYRFEDNKVKVIIYIAKCGE